MRWVRKSAIKLRDLRRSIGDYGCRWDVGHIYKIVEVHKESLNNLRRGVVERVFQCKGPDGQLRNVPRPNPGVFRDRMSWIRGQVVDGIVPCRPMGRDEFLNTYSGRRRKLYAKAADVHELRGVIASDSHIRAFIKIEALLKKDAVPRIIQPRKPALPVYGYALGRYIKRYEVLFKQTLRKRFGYDVICKGKNMAQRAAVLRAAWDSFHEPVALPMDASRFDQHVSRDALAWEHSVWLRYCPSESRAELKNLLDMQLRNHCVAACPGGVVRYTTDGCRMSGDMNTSAGNCMLMACMLLQYAHDRDVSVKVVNDGDDSVVILERRDVCRFRDGLEEWFSEIGFDMEVEDVVTVFEKIEFCQAHPVWNGSEWVMVRTPQVAMSKDLTLLRNLPTEVDYLAWMQAVSDCGHALTSGVPVYGPFYDMFNTGVRGGSSYLEDRGMTRLAAGMVGENRPITPEARVSFYNAFGVLPDVQEELESYFSHIRLTDSHWLEYWVSDRPSLLRPIEH